jgi:hypothetical protein
MAAVGGLLQAAVCIIITRLESLHEQQQAQQQHVLNLVW